MNGERFEEKVKVVASALGAVGRTVPPEPPEEEPEPEPEPEPDPDGAPPDVCLSPGIKCAMKDRGSAWVEPAKTYHISAVSRVPREGLEHCVTLVSTSRGAPHVGYHCIATA